MTSFNHIGNAFISLLLNLLICHVSLGRDPMLEKFETEYPRANRRLRDFYTNMRMTAKETRPGRSKEEDGKSAVPTWKFLEWEFGGNGRSLRRVVIPSQDHRTDSFTVFVADPKLSFELRKTSSEAAYSVTAMGEPSPDDYQEIVDVIHRNSSVAGAPYYYAGMNMIDFMKKIGFHGLRASEILSPAGKRIKVDWDASKSTLRGWFLFEENSWALCGYDVSRAEKQKDGRTINFARVGDFEYSGTKDGIPLIRRFEIRNRTPSGLYPNLVSEVTSLVVGLIPEKDFKPSAFGVRHRYRF